LFLIPLYIRLLERVEVIVECSQGALSSIWGVLLEEFVEQPSAAFHNYETTVSLSGF